MSNKSIIEHYVSIDPIAPARIKSSKVQTHKFEGVAGEIDGHKKMRILRKSQCSSLFRPNESYIRKLHNGQLPKKYDTVTMREVRCYRLDTLLKELPVVFDILKSDSQGAELEILQGLGNRIHELVAMHLEIFHESFYEGIHLFPEIDSFLRLHGFYMAKQLRVASYFGDYLYLADNPRDFAKFQYVCDRYGVSG